jgi:hypothetical protein
MTVKALVFAAFASMLFGTVQVNAASDGHHFTVVADNGEAGRETLLSLRSQASTQADRIFFDARLAMLQANLPRAETYFRRTLAIAPDHRAARAYLGLTLAEMNRADAAIYHYRFALAQELPASVSDPIRQYVSSFERQSGWRVFAYFNTVRQTNPFEQSGLDRVNVGGFDFVLPTIGTGEPETVLRFGGALRGRHTLGENTRLNTSLGVALEYYLDSHFTTAIVNPAIAYQIDTSDATALAFGLGAEFTFADGKLVEQEYGPEFQYTYRLSDRMRGAVSLSHYRIETPDRAFAKGFSNEISVTGEAVVRPDLAFYATASMYQRNLQRERIGYDRLTALLGARKLFAHGIQLEGSMEIEKRKFHADSQIFETTRDDLTSTFALTVGSSQISYKGFSPRIRIEREVRSSNIAVFDMQNTSVSLNVTRSF